MGSGTEAAYRAELERSDDPAATLADIRARLDASPGKPSFSTRP